MPFPLDAFGVVPRLSGLPTQIPGYAYGWGGAHPSPSILAPYGSSILWPYPNKIPGYAYSITRI